VQGGRADWDDILVQRAIMRLDDKVLPHKEGKLDIWQPKQSGKDGPLVMQLT
jgi:hypothetical protein